MSVTSGDIDAVCDLVVDLCGVYLDESKAYLIESRLDDVLRRSGCRNYVELASRVQRQGDRALVSFRKLNLLEPFHGLGPFDIVFCRNVAIYFTPEVRRDLFDRLTQTLTPDGYLFTGVAESLTDLGPRFRPRHHCRSVFYQPNLPLASPA